MNSGNRVTKISNFKFQKAGAWFALVLCCYVGKLVAQENIPMGTWRSHLSFNAVKHIAEGDRKIFAASENAVMYFLLDDRTTGVYSTLNALSNTGISALAFDATRNQLVVGYSNGGVDLLTDDQSISFTRLINPPDVTVAPGINHILIDDALAYLSTNYGVVVYDLTRNEVKETWRNIGPGGQLINIYQSAVLNGSIYLGTSKGVLVGNLSDNLLDFNQWNSFASGEFNTAIRQITTYNQQVYVAIDQQGLYRFDGNAWLNEIAYPTLATYSFLNGEETVLLYGGENFFYSVNQVGEVSAVVDPLISQPQGAILYDDKYWVADAGSGLISNDEGVWRPYLPNGPSSPVIAATKYGNTEMLAIHGGVSEDFTNSNSFPGLSTFSQGLWSLTTTNIDYITDVETSSDKALFIGSFGQGLEKLGADGTSTIFNESNSPLRNITALEKSTSGLWIANYGAAESLNLLELTSELKSFSFASTSARYPFELAVDASENVWMLISSSGGGGVFIVKKDGSILRYLSDQPGAGLLPSKEVLSIAVDKNDYVWIGTATGVAYYTYAGDDGIRPTVDGRALLKEERVTSIAVDAGDRKWMGTERGVWLFNATGEEFIHNFNTENSPIPSNNILDIEIDPVSGEVFFTTDKGLISFRSDATEGVVGEEVKIFPNPVNPDFTGLVGISNLVANAVVKITDVSGKLVNQLQANGGSASWNLADYTGKRVRSGVYLIISSAQDGSESVTGKVVVVD
jgi:ligand-binding sensor domain-containing protein